MNIPSLKKYAIKVIKILVYIFSCDTTVVVTHLVVFLLCLLVVVTLQ